MARTVQQIVQHHVAALATKDIDEILSDYSEQSALLSPTGAARGLDELRAMFTGVLESLPGFFDAILISSQEYEGDVGYIAWTAPGYFTFGTDTFVVRDDKILVQTFGGAPVG